VCCEFSIDGHKAKFLCAISLLQHEMCVATDAVEARGIANKLCGHTNAMAALQARCAAEVIRALVVMLA